MSKDFRYQQATKEARWSLWITLLYLVGWCVCAYLSPKTSGWLGFPLWFELSCLYLPILFSLIVFIVTRFVYQDIDLNKNSEK
ncbi:hypothetical protein CEP49_07745 [Mergibacter septicus]|uniref:YhdT family protein n=1 Tax=Mergibacter septicus TaxID=221402 RepID=UPI0011797825|nr:DUF997 family protein [Mergibacter septicus]AWX14428.1 hypothetical protein CEP49_07745 [Mergibacter septicus]